MTESSLTVKRRTLNLIMSISEQTSKKMLRYLIRNCKAYRPNKQKHIRFVLYEQILILKVFSHEYNIHKNLNNQTTRHIIRELYELTKRHDTSIKYQMEQYLSYTNEEEILKNMEVQTQRYYCRKALEVKRERKLKVKELSRGKKEMIIEMDKVFGDFGQQRILKSGNQIKD